MLLQIEAIVPQKTHGYFNGFRQVLADAGTDNVVVKAAYAYATLGGVQSFLDSVSTVAQWSQVPKQFIVGVHHAITEPAALEQLMGIAKADVKIFIPNKRISRKSFIANPTFHPKVLGVTSLKGDRLHYLIGGSANLTGFAIGAVPRNYELGIAVSAKQHHLDPKRIFAKWWKPLWDYARPLNSNLLSSYASLREQEFNANPILQMQTEVPSTIANAKFFFIEVGAGSGPVGARHQVEFSEPLVRFFGPPKRHRLDLTLISNGSTWRGRPLSYKKTTFDVEIWRLGMPTQTSGGVPVAERAIGFWRTNSKLRFEFEVVDIGSKQFKQWLSNANAQGHLGATHSERHRRYGFI